MPTPSRELTCSPVLLRPFARQLAQEGAPAALQEKVAALANRADRIAVHDFTALADEIADSLGDPDIGLRAALQCRRGDFAALEWVVASARNVGEAVLTACRYARVLSDAADIRVEAHGSHTHLIIGSTLPVSRVVADYQVACYSIISRTHTGVVAPQAEIWFEHSRPADVSAYDAVYPDNRVVFDAAFNGFNDSAPTAHQQLPDADPSLHAVLRDHADQLLEQIAPDGDLVRRVCAHILENMHTGQLSIEATASHLATTRSTLTRQLGALGTSYTTLLNQNRYRTAIHYLRYSDQTVEDIAFLLGYSELSPFTRAFRRWSGTTPVEYRKANA